MNVPRVNFISFSDKVDTTLVISAYQGIKLGYGNSAKTVKKKSFNCHLVSCRINKLMHFVFISTSCCGLSHNEYEYMCISLYMYI